MNGKNRLLTGVAATTIVFGTGCVEPKWYFDNDGDGYGDPAIVVSAEVQPDQYVANGADCNDIDSAINPGALEIFDSIDNDCDGEIDNVPYWYADTDEDGYGDPNDSLQEPTQPVDYVSDNTDCDDTNPEINPGAGETAGDSIDNNCDGLIDEYVIGHAGPAGGIVFYVDGTGYHGLEAAPEDQSGALGAEWGCADIDDIPGADSTAIGTGAQNTADMLAANCTPDYVDSDLAVDLVANYTLNGFEDWFLPSKTELDVLYSKRSVVGGFGSSIAYWSSTESIDGVFGSSAWAKVFVGQFPFRQGKSMGFAKYSVLGVRAVRAF